MNKHDNNIARSISIVMLGDILVKGLGYLTIPLYLLIMSKEDFGLFTFLLLISTQISTTLILSTNSYQIKEFQHPKYFSKTILSSTIIGSAVISGCLSSAIYIILQLTSSGIFTKNNINYNLIFCILSFIFSLNLIIYSHLVASRRPKHIVIFGAVRFFLNNSLSILLILSQIYSGDNVINRGVSHILGETVLLLFFLTWLKKNEFHFSFDRNYFVNAMRFGIVALPSSVSGILILFFDRYMLQYHHGLDSLADYNLAYLLLMPLNVFMSAVQSTLAPYVFQSKHISQAFARTRKSMPKINIIQFSVLLALSTLCFLLADIGLIPVEYNNTVLLVFFLGLGTVFATTRQLISNIFIYSNKPSIPTIISLFVSCSCIVSAVYFTEEYSYYALSVTYMASNFFAVIVSYFLARRTVSLH